MSQKKDALNYLPLFLNKNLIRNHLEKNINPKNL